MTHRFGVFEFDSLTGELHKSGRRVPLEPQPARVLALLLARAGTLVSRDEVKEAAWGSDVHVDFDRGLAYCLSHIRTALGDSAQNSRFVQTLPKQGYRFIAPVEAASNARAAPAISANSPVWSARPGWWVWAAALMVALVAAVSLSGGPPGNAVVAVSVFDNETGRDDLDRRVAALSDQVVTRLTAVAPGRVAIIGNAAILRRPRNIRDLRTVAAELPHADYVVLGQLQARESGYQFITHLIRLSDETHLRANRLTFPDSDLSRLEDAVAAEFERAVRAHLIE